MSTPVVVLAYFRPAPGQRDQVVEALRPAISAVHQEPGCELYAIHDAPDGTIVMIEKWTSVRELDDHGEWRGRTSAECIAMEGRSGVARGGDTAVSRCRRGPSEQGQL